MAVTGYFICKQDLLTILDYFENHKPASVGDKVLKGLVFRFGQKASGEDALFPDPLYADNPTGDPDVTKDVLIPNDNVGPGCPYPPGYFTIK